MSFNRSLLWLTQIQDEASQILRSIEDRDLAALLTDPQLERAITMGFIVNGEAATRLIDQRPEIAAAASRIDWLQVRALRNRAAHDYFSIDFEIVWDIVQDDLPVLLEELPFLIALAKSASHE